LFVLRFNHPDWVPMQTRRAEAFLDGPGEGAAVTPGSADLPTQ
jgi:hypothetical protein